MGHRFFLAVFFFGMFVPLGANASPDGTCAAERSSRSSAALGPSSPFHRKINFVFPGNRQTPNPEGWEEYDGSIYNAERGYGWLTDLSQSGRDRGAEATVVLPNGTKTSPQDLGRLELANWQGRHQENRPLIFRIDLPDGWYRVTCTSVDPGTRLPMVDQRSFKCRSHDAVFAGANYGLPLVIGGDELVEGSGVVEVTEGHLRIVVGDPAYSGWTWAYHGPWYSGWVRWWGFEHQYAHDWYQKLTRTVDPGFHSLRLNSLEVERVAAPTRQSSLVFRDFFNRDDNSDINAGIARVKRWSKTKLLSDISDNIRTELYKTSLKLTSPQSSSSAIGLLQQKLSPAEGIVRYSTRVSLLAGEGSQRHSGAQEAGILMLADPSEFTDFHSTFVGVGFDPSRSETQGWLIYRVGDGKEGYRTNLEVPDTTLPFEVIAGEFEIVVEHDIVGGILRQISVNDIDITYLWPLQDRMQRISQGLFGIRSAMSNTSYRVRLQQFYWYYNVENL